tara:strand:- start:539 stop:802 length:264 start_codon:yes stop_codon:yes gene_type:complete
MITIEHEGITFEITKVDTRIKSGFYKGHEVLNGSGKTFPEGYKLIERNHKGEFYNFNNTIYTENGINQLMIQRTSFCGSQIPTDKLI